MITIAIIVITALVSFVAFSNTDVMERFLLYPYKMRNNNELERLITHTLLHSGIFHLAFNMLALYSFGVNVENVFVQIFGIYGRLLYLLMYVLSGIAAGLPDLVFQKNNYSYKSLGASGAVSGVIFSSILFFPTSGISIMFLPSMPAYIFAPLFIVVSLILSRTMEGQINHLAHVVGAVTGFLITIGLCYAKGINIISYTIQQINA